MARSASPGYSASRASSAGDEPADGGSREPEARGDEHHARVAFASGYDELGVQRAEIAQVGGHDGALLSLRHGDDVGIGERPSTADSCCPASQAACADSLSRSLSSIHSST